MNIFVVPLIVVLIAIGFSGRIVFLRGAGREASKSLGAARYVAWSAVGFSLALAIIKSGLAGPTQLQPRLGVCRLTTERR